MPITSLYSCHKVSLMSLTEMDTAVVVVVCFAVSLKLHLILKVYTLKVESLQCLTLQDLVCFALI